MVLSVELMSLEYQTAYVEILPLNLTQKWSFATMGEITTKHGFRCSFFTASCKANI